MIHVIIIKDWLRHSEPATVAELLEHRLFECDTPALPLQGYAGPIIVRKGST